ncbi:MAG: CD225/dispanin family protein [Pirellulales bacterium]
MRCTRCGTESPDGSPFCTKCGGQLAAAPAGRPSPYAASTNPFEAPPSSPGNPYVNSPGMAPGVKPQNYLVQSILTTLCCCLPFGIVAIIFAVQVDSKWNQGDFAGAQKSSDNAKMWSWVAFGCGIVAAVIQVILQMSVMKDMPRR